MWLSLFAQMRNGFMQGPSASPVEPWGFFSYNEKENTHPKFKQKAVFAYV
jgi:hypothetical protein